MDLEKLLDPFPVKKEAELIAKSIANDPKYMKELWDFAISDSEIAWRAAWIMDKVHDIAPDLIRPFIQNMVQHIPNLNHEGKIRQFLKIISIEPLPKEVSGTFITHCFNLLTKKTTAVAVKVYAMQILYNFSLREPDIQNELALVITEQMKNGSAGICSRGKRILRFLSS